jgi:hypothetical protein
MRRRRPAQALRRLDVQGIVRREGGGGDRHPEHHQQDRSAQSDDAALPHHP